MRRLPFMLFLFALTLPLAARATDDPQSIPTEITVDEYCRIASMDNSNPAKPRPRHRYDGGICRLDGGVKRSLTYETVIRNGVSKEKAVQVVEREFLLHNPYTERITFVVKQQLAKDYHIDSDPQADEVMGSVATFRVLAEPNQTVRLHVGERK